MDIQIGPHVFRNTDGTIEVEGVPQLELTQKKPGGPLQLNFAIFDSTGKMPGKVVNNSLAMNEQRAYNLDKESTSLKLTRAETGEEVLILDWNEENLVKIPKGQFYTLKGHILRITPLELSVDKITLKEGETDMKGKPAMVG
jgi:hypothetical protein